MNRKITALLLAALLLCLVSVSAQAAEQKNWKDWSQSDPRWADIPLGNSTTTIGKSGCLVTSVSKLMLQSGFVTEDVFDTGIMVTWLNENNTPGSPSFTAGGGLYWGKPARMIEGFELVDQAYGKNNGITGNSADCEAAILQLVEQQYHVIVAVKNFGHYVAVDNAKTLATGRVYIMDSLPHVPNTGVLLTDRYPSVASVALYSGWTEEALRNTSYLYCCTAYPSYCEIAVTAGTAVRTLPCNEETDPNSAEVEAAGAGDTYTAVRLYRNPEGELWYRVETKKGGTGYLFGGDAEFAAQLTDDISIRSVSAPTELEPGCSYSLRGVISTGKQLLHQVGACVTAQGENTVLTGGMYDVEPTTSFSIRYSDVNYGVGFSGLGVGEYTYTIAAGVQSYYAAGGTELAVSEVTDLVLHESPFSVVEGHAYTSEMVGPSCEGWGYTSFTCSRCGDYYEEDFIEPLGHTHGESRRENEAEDGSYDWVTYCSVCGGVAAWEHMESGAAQPGDMDGNGELNVDDAIQLLFHVLIGDGYEVSQDCDLDGDGDADVDDAVYLLLHILIGGALYPLN